MVPLFVPSCVSKSWGKENESEGENFNLDNAAHNGSQQLHVTGGGDFYVRQNRKERLPASSVVDVAQLVGRLPEVHGTLGSIPITALFVWRAHVIMSVEAHTCNPSTPEVEARWSGVEGHQERVPASLTIHEISLLTRNKQKPKLHHHTMSD